MNTKEIKRAMKAYEIAVEESNRADEAYGENPEDETLEAAFDRAYAAERAAFENLADALVRFTAGQIDKATASVMIHKQYTKLAALVAVAM